MNKFNLFKQDLSELYIDKVPINLSPSLSFRSRCEFGYSKNAYTMKDSSKTIYLNKFLYADRSIQELMPKILEIILNSMTDVFWMSELKRMVFLRVSYFRSE